MLYLIRHPRTQPNPAAPASSWGLSSEGEVQVRALVALPWWPQVAAIYTSAEAKTRAVGQAIQAAYGLPWHVVAALGEARRDTWLEPDAFHAAQRAFFARPAQPPVPAWESAQAAQSRFTAAMQHILNQHPPGASVAVVSHATVLTLYAAHLRGATPSFEEWQATGFAAIMAVDRLHPVTPFLEYPYLSLPQEDNS